MTIDFSAYPNADAATIARTENFFELAKKEEATDAELLTLAQQGIYVNVQDDDGYTPLMWSAGKGYCKTTSLLLAAGANTQTQAHEGDTALLGAAFYGHTQTVKMLLAAGANIEARNRSCDTALMRATSGRNMETMQVLLNAGANIAAQDNNGAQALRSAKNQAEKDLLNPTLWHACYADFVARGTAPESAEDIYHLLAVTPLVNPKAPVDYEGNIRKIFANAHWADKEQAANVVTQLQRDGRINAQMADSLLGTAFPEQLHAARLQRNSSGIVR